jgi:hypothetical protein
VQLCPVIDPAARQVLELGLHGVTEVERQVLDDEKIVCHSTYVTREPVVLQPHARVGLPSYLGMFVGAWESEGNFVSRTF